MSLFNNNFNDNDHSDSDNDNNNDIDESLLSLLRPEALAALLEFRNDNCNNNTTTNDMNDNSNRSLPNKVFAEKSYWEDRFNNEESYEWLLSYKDIEKNINSHLNHNDNILIVGCGNSNFSSDLYDQGYHNIVNIDFSEVVIDRMKKANDTSRPDMKWLVMDMTKMSFDINTFDVVIDKASMDALCVDEKDVWDPLEGVIENVHLMCTDISRILKPNGIFLSLSFAQPHFRTKYLYGSRINGNVISNPYEIMRGYSHQYSWTLAHEKIMKGDVGTIEFYLYHMKKGQEQ